MQFTRALRPIIVITSALVMTAGFTACSTPQKALTGGSGHANVNFYALPDPTGATQTIVDKCNATRDSKFTIALKQAEPGDPRTQITRKLSARDSTLDLMEIDVDWNAEFTAAGWAQRLTGRTKSQIAETTLNGPFQAATNNKRLFAAPLTTNTQVLWYRSDLVPRPPKTWDEVKAAAATLRNAKKPFQVETYGPQSSSLTVLLNELTWSAGGSLLSDNGKRVATDSNDEMVAAVELLRSLASEGELSSNGMAGLTGGASAFAIASTNAFGADQPPANITWAPFPVIDPSGVRGPQLGGTNLVVSAYSSHQRQAVAAMECLRSAENQRTVATVGKRIPVLRELHEDPEVQAVFPRLSELTPQISKGVPPLQTPVVASIENAVNKTLMPLLNPESARNTDASTMKAQLEVAINAALNFRSIQD